MSREQMSILQRQIFMACFHKNGLLSLFLWAFQVTVVVDMIFQGIQHLKSSAAAFGYISHTDLTCSLTRCLCWLCSRYYIWKDSFSLGYNAKFSGVFGFSGAGVGQK